MISARLLIALVVLGTVSAEQTQLAKIFERVERVLYYGALKIWNLGQVVVHEGEDFDHGDGHRGHHDWHKFHHGGHRHRHHGEDHDWHRGHDGGKMYKKIQEAHMCHHSCGMDSDCHSKCPKPWATFAKACEDLPAIEACHVKCKDTECDKCPKFEEDWLNEKFASHHDQFIKKAQTKCPMIEKAHACHQACTPGDHECHHKCPSLFPGDHGHGGMWHHHGEHGEHHHGEHGEHHRGEHGDHEWHHGKHGGLKRKFKEEMEKAHACHEQCGADVACHQKCPKPWEPIVKACEDFPKIKACHASCKDAECDKCPKFEKEWMNEKFAKHPERAAMMAEHKCPMIAKIHACHQACKPGDHECHHKCPSMFPGHGEGHGGMWHHHGEHGEHHHGEKKEAKFHKDMMKLAKACHLKCGEDAECHSKCPKPWEPIVKACEDFPKIKACHDSCKDSECQKCPKFEKEWMNKEFAMDPEKAAKKVEEKCPMIEKIHACHQACKPGDFQCHHKCCPSMKHGKEEQHGEEEHQEAMAILV